ncbi:hypothetical protein FF011L_03650 [Roseimaritima multifibrata]|uniref:Uncharacterized protein n=1 Tax=Roseimaritima multifibrata TaxID=1930274 RepID=A0A517M9U1_9BACT|nr:hypothetical protein FF011L_03650 [Roseimaritima multifibrata]
MWGSGLRPVPSTFLAERREPSGIGGENPMDLWAACAAPLGIWGLALRSGDLAWWTFRLRLGQVRGPDGLRRSAKNGGRTAPWGGLGQWTSWLHDLLRRSCSASMVYSPRRLAGAGRWRLEPLVGLDLAEALLDDFRRRPRIVRL